MAPSAPGRRSRRGSGAAAIDALVVASGVAAVIAHRVEVHSHEEMHREAFPVTGLKAAAALVGSQALRDGAGLGGGAWRAPRSGLAVEGALPARAPEAAFAASPVAHRSSANAGHSTRLFASALEYLPEEWKYNLVGLKRMAGHKDGIIFRGRMRNEPYQEVAVKYLHPETEIEARHAAREIGVMKKFAGKPGFITMYKAKFATTNDISAEGEIEPDSDIFILMEPADGNLQEKVLELPPRRVGYDTRIRLFIDVLRAAVEMKKSMLVHREITPGNILILGDCDKPERCQAILADFGNTCSQPGGPWGADKTNTRFQYLAPEVYEEESDSPQRDVWSLGIVLYQLFGRYGAPPLEFELLLKKGEPTKDKIEKLYEYWNIENDPFFSMIEAADPRIAELLTKMLEKKPSKRITVEGALQKMEDIAEGREIDTSMRTETPTLKGWSEEPPKQSMLKAAWAAWNPLEDLPDEWRNNLAGLKRIAKNKDGIIFKGKVRGDPGQEVVLKYMYPKTKLAATHAEREVSLLTELSGEPGFVTLFKASYETSSEDGKGDNKLVPDSDAFILMEQAIGNLKAVVLKKPFDVVSLNTRIRIFADIVRAIVRLKEMNVVHRDITPGNILIVGDADSPEDWHAVLADFGNACSFSGGKWPADSTNARLQYIAPEVFDEESDRPSRDVWSLGICLYQMLNKYGGRPFEFEYLKDAEDWKDKVQTTFKIENDPFFKGINSMEPKLGDILKKMLRKAPESRMTAEGILGLLEDLAEERGIDISPRTDMPALTGWVADADRPPSRLQSIARKFTGSKEQVVEKAAVETLEED